MEASTREVSRRDLGRHRVKFDFYLDSITGLVFDDHRASKHYCVKAGHRDVFQTSHKVAITADGEIPVRWKFAVSKNMSRMSETQYKAVHLSLVVLEDDGIQTQQTSLLIVKIGLHDLVNEKRRKLKIKVVRGLSKKQEEGHLRVTDLPMLRLSCITRILEKYPDIPMLSSPMTENIVPITPTLDAHQSIMATPLSIDDNGVGRVRAPSSPFILDPVDATGDTLHSHTEHSTKPRKSVSIGPVSSITEDHNQFSGIATDDSITHYTDTGTGPSPNSSFTLLGGTILQPTHSTTNQIDTGSGPSPNSSFTVIQSATRSEPAQRSIVQDSDVPLNTFPTSSYPVPMVYGFPGYAGHGHGYTPFSMYPSVIKIRDAETSPMPSPSSSKVGQRTKRPMRIFTKDNNKEIAVQESPSHGREMKIEEHPQESLTKSLILEVSNSSVNNSLRERKSPDVSSEIRPPVADPPEVKINNKPDQSPDNNNYIEPAAIVSPRDDTTAQTLLQEHDMIPISYKPVNSLPTESQIRSRSCQRGGYPLWEYNACGNYWKPSEDSSAVSNHKTVSQHNYIRPEVYESKIFGNESSSKRIPGSHRGRGKLRDMGDSPSWWHQPIGRPKVKRKDGSDAPAPQGICEPTSVKSTYYSFSPKTAKDALTKRLSQERIIDNDEGGALLLSRRHVSWSSSQRQEHDCNTSLNTSPSNTSLTQNIISSSTTSTRRDPGQLAFAWLPGKYGLSNLIEAPSNERIPIKKTEKCNSVSTVQESSVCYCFFVFSPFLLIRMYLV